MQTPENSHIIRLSLGTWASRQEAGLVMCSYPKVYSRQTQQATYLQSVAIIQQLQFSNVPFPEFCYSFFFWQSGIPTSLPVVREALNLVLTFINIVFLIVCKLYHRVQAVSYRRPKGQISLSGMHQEKEKEKEKWQKCNRRVFGLARKSRAGRQSGVFMSMFVSSRPYKELEIVQLKYET